MSPNFEAEFSANLLMEILRPTQAAAAKEETNKGSESDKEAKRVCFENFYD